MLDNHEPSTPATAFGSLSHEERAEIVRKAVLRAHAERAKAIQDLTRGLFGVIAFWRKPRGDTPTAPRSGCKPHFVRHV